METIAISNTDTKTIFQSQQRTALRLKKSGEAERIERLQKLRQSVINHTESIVQALYNNFKKPVDDAKLEADSIVGN